MMLHCQALFWTELLHVLQTEELFNRDGMDEVELTDSVFILTRVTPTDCFRQSY